MIMPGVPGKRPDKDRLMKSNKYARALMVIGAFWAMFTYFPPV